MTVGEILAEPIRFHGLAQGRAVNERVQGAPWRLSASPARRRQLPARVLGGQRQRIGTARPGGRPAAHRGRRADLVLGRQHPGPGHQPLPRPAVAARPRFLFIAHDLAAVRHVSDRIVVLYLGKVMETAPAATLFRGTAPSLFRVADSAVPIPDVEAERSRRRILLEGDPPSAIPPAERLPLPARAAPSPARSAPPRCRRSGASPGHFAACHFPGGMGEWR
ncbi:MAG: hypothetical protein R3D25_13405 [Geminicoccaceae bacterium]